MKRAFSISNRISSDFDGYNHLSMLNHNLKGFMFEDIYLDFSNNNWFEANLCAVLGAVINNANANLNNIRLENLNPSQKNIFSRNNFLASFGGEKIIDYNDTTIKYRRFKQTEDKLIRDYLERELIKKQDFPKLSLNAKKEIINSLFEIYSNAILHGDCDDVFSCGQLYPQKNPPRIDFTIVDMGKTIKKNVNEFLKKDISGTEAIKWALEENNTTKPRENNIPGGLGLKLIFEFVCLNKGKLQIVSSDGYWELSKQKETSSKLTRPFPGTIVNIEFNLDDKSFYYLKEEKSEEIIF